MWRLLSAAGIAGLLWLGAKIDDDILGYKFPDLPLIDCVKIASGFYFSLFFLTGGHRLLYIIYKTLPRDLM